MVSVSSLNTPAIGIPPSSAREQQTPLRDEQANKLQSSTLTNSSLTKADTQSQQQNSQQSFLNAKKPAEDTATPTGNRRGSLLDLTV